MRNRLALLAIGFVLIPSGFAQDASLRASGVDASALRLDGRLDEHEWATADAATGFRQRSPVEGATAMGQTVVSVLYSADALWIGARMTAPDSVEIRAPLTRRDELGDAERLVVWLDTYRDGRSAFAFGVTASGVRLDWISEDDDESILDLSFDPVWEAETHVTPEAWTAEMRIPLSQIRFLAGGTDVWGLNIARMAPARNEEAYWQLVRRDASGWVSRFGALTGMQALRAPRRIEATPYVASGALVRGEVDPANPFASSGEIEPRAGADAKAGIGPSLTLEATVNPDFGQVEADPATINLTAFEIVFDERRPFFVEGSDLLRGSGPTYFYSRRIGAAPRGEASGAFVDRPSQTTILGAAKLTGRLARGLSIGALAAVTAPEYARALIAGGNVEERVRIEPTTASAVLRAQHEVGGNRPLPFFSTGSTAGLSLTALRRDVSADQPLALRLPEYALAGGLDWDLRLSDGDYRIAGFVGASGVGGTPEAITRIQRASQRYFQRPDDARQMLDTTRHALEGSSAMLAVEKRSGQWLWDASATITSPGFEINDLGQLGSADALNTFASLTYRDTEVTGSAARGLRRYSFKVFGFTNFNLAGDYTFGAYGFDTEVEWTNFWQTSTHMHLRPRGVSVTATRGGPLLGTPADWHVAASIRGNPASRLEWQGAVDHIADELGGRSVGVNGTLAIRPAPWLRLALQPRYAFLRDTRQYVTALPDGPLATFGNRYVLGTLEQHTVAAQGRAFVAVSPDLTLEMYAEPFATSGRFVSFGDVEEPGALPLRVYGEAPATNVWRDEERNVRVRDGDATFEISNPDVDLVSLRSTVVFRWEWRPGSSLYAVWQQDRGATDQRTSHVTPASLLDAFDIVGDHIFQLKLTYWLPLG